MSATVRLCLVGPAADTDEIVTAAVSMITTIYTAPGDRIMLAAPEAPETVSSRTRRDRLVESALRLGRGATTGADFPPHRDHKCAAAGGGPYGGPGAESGLGPQPGHEAKSVADPTKQQSLRAPFGPDSDGFALIIAGWSGLPFDLFAITDWAPTLTPAGAVVVLTHSSDQHWSPAVRSGQLSEAAACAGLILTDRLILAHQSPCTPRTAPRPLRQAVALGGHRHLHTTASVFRLPEATRHEKTPERGAA